jgi:hypothetical protein
LVEPYFFLKVKHTVKQLITFFLRFALDITHQISLHAYRSNIVSKDRRSLGYQPRYEDSSLRPNSVALIPYNTFDCNLFFATLANCLNAKGALRARVTQKDLEERRNLLPRKKPPSGSYTYHEKLEIFLDVFGDGTNSARGAIDEYRHLASNKELLTRSPINADLWNRIINQRDFAQKLSRLYDVFVIPDLGYTFNRTLLDQAHIQNKKIFVINPRGFVTDASDIHRLPTSRRNVQEIVKLLDLSNFSSGLENSIINNYGDFTKQLGGTETEVETKTLFLHCLRDSDSGILPMRGSDSNPFLDYLEWTDYAFEIIGRNSEQWKIRIHPHSDRFAGEKELIYNLMSKHSLSKELIEQSNISTQTLVKTSAIFTHSGSIALELLALGKFANCSSTFYPETFSNQLLSREDMHLAFEALPSNSGINKWSNLSQSVLASFCLELITSPQKQVAQACTPKTKLERNHDEFYRNIQELQLASRYAISINTNSSRREFDVLANWIHESSIADSALKNWILAQNIEQITGFN